MIQAQEQQTLPEPRLGIEPKDIWHALSRWKWLILASTVVVGGAVAAGTMRQPKIYAAQASIMIEPVLPKVLDDPVGFEEVSSLARAELVFANTQYEVIRSQQVLLAAGAALQLDKNSSFLQAYGIDPDSHEDLLSLVAKRLEQQLKVVPQKGSRIVHLVVEDQDPKRAADIANEIAKAYRTHTLDKRLSATLDAQQWLDQQVAEFSNRLQQSNERLNKFRQADELSLEDRKSMNTAKLAKLDTELVSVRTALIRARSKKTIVEGEIKKKGGVEASIPELSANPSVATLKTLLIELRNKRAQVEHRYGPKHDSMQGIDAQIAHIETQLKTELAYVVETLDNEIREFEETEKGIINAMNVERVASAELDKLFAQYRELSRDYDMNKTTYESLLKRQIDADLSSRLKSSFVQMFEAAEPRLSPVRPSLPKNTAIGALAGLLLGVMIAVAALLLDNTVRSQVDLEQGFGLTFLGIVPTIEEGGAAPVPAAAAGAISPSRDLYVVRNPKSSLAECVRSIRTNVLFMGTDKPLKKILVTSPGPSEGKSTIATNLAVVMAQAGNRVLLVDTDLRRPRLHRAFGVASEVGLTSVLLKASLLKDVVRSTEVHGMDVLPCGPLPPNPAELLHSKHFAELVEELERMYDRIIFDSPPVNAVTDAVILSQLADGTLLVAKAGTTAKDGVRRALRQLFGVKAKLLGCVLNDVDLQNAAYGYSYYYYSRRYAYGVEEKSAEV